MLTGVEPHFDACEDFDVKQLVQSGKLPVIDQRWRDRSNYEAALVNLILDMWKIRPQQRPAIDLVVKRLQEILD